jgi:hypothetical protein
MITIQKHMAISLLGEQVEINQWQILDNGVLIGYLPHLVDSEILPLANFPWHKTDEVVAACVAQRPMFCSEESKVNPPQTHLKQVVEAIQSQLENESDEDDE